MYDKAIRYDSTFAMAYARRALSRALAYRSGTMQDNINNEKCRDDAERAIRLNPRLAEAYIAYGMYYYCYKNDYHNALINFNQSSELDPGNWQSLFYSATVYRRMGEWTKSQSLMAKVLKYNPQDALVLTNIAASYCYLRVYDTALIYNDQAIKIMPDWSSPYLNKYQTIILNTGDTREARQLIDTAVKYTGYRFLKEKITLDIYDRNYSAALFKTELSEQDDFGNQGDRLLNYGTIYEYLKRNDLAKTYYDSALVFFNKQLKKNVNPGTCILAAYAYAGVKNYSKAIESARKSIELTDNQLSKSDNLIYLVEIYIRCGEYKEALKKIDDLLKNPSYLSVTKLEIDPVYDPVRNSPEFSMLLDKYRKNE
jgi:tetratricopeptide (TPR) repeat protein